MDNMDERPESENAAEEYIVPMSRESFFRAPEFQADAGDEHEPDGGGHTPDDGGHELEMGEHAHENNEHESDINEHALEDTEHAPEDGEHATEDFARAPGDRELEYDAWEQEADAADDFEPGKHYHKRSFFAEESDSDQSGDVVKIDGMDDTHDDIADEVADADADHDDAAAEAAAAEDASVEVADAEDAADHDDIAAEAADADADAAEAAEDAADIAVVDEKETGIAKKDKGRGVAKKAKRQNVAKKDMQRKVAKKDKPRGEVVVRKDKKKSEITANGGRGRVFRAAGRVVRFILRMIKRLVILAVFLSIAAAIYYYYRIYLPSTGNDKEYLLSEAIHRDLYSYVSATGKIAVTNEVSLYLKVPQKVEKTHVKVGDRVYAGQKLVTYDIASELRSLELKRQIAEINKLNAELGAQNIALPAGGNELLSYTADVNSARKSVQDSENAIESIKIRINQQQIRVDDAKSLTEKNSDLYDKGFLAKDEYDQSVSAYKNASESLNDLILSLDGEEKNLAYRRSQLTNAEQKLSNARSALSDEASKLRYDQQMNNAELSRIEIEQINDDIQNLIEYTVCPVDGTVDYLGAVNGATAPRGNPVIRILDLSTVIVKADITQYDAPRLATGQKADIYVVGLPEKPYAGTVKKISASSIEKENGSEKEIIVPVEIAIDDADSRVKVGYKVDIDVIEKERKDVLSVPSQAIFTDEEGRFVYLLSELGAANVDAAAETDAGEATEFDITAIVNIRDIDGAVEYGKNLLAFSLEKLDGLFPQRVSDAPVPVRRPVIAGFAGDNGVEIKSGLIKGDKVVLNP